MLPALRPVACRAASSATKLLRPATSSLISSSSSSERSATRFQPRTQTMSLGTIGQSVRDELKKSEIIPDVIDDFHPSLLLQVSYPSSHQTANLGNTIKPSDAQDTPVIELHSSDAATHGSSYTLVLTDPDAPSREDPKWSEFCHWIATNVPLTAASNSVPAEGNGAQSTSTQTAAKGLKEIVEYSPPAPPPKTGKHRYVLLAFEPANGKSSGNLTTPGDRKQWGTGKVRHGVRQWAEKNNLIPVGANFFYSQNDEQ